MAVDMQLQNEFEGFHSSLPRALKKQKQGNEELLHLDGLDMIQ